MTVPDAKRLKEFESENARLKRRLAESILDAEALRSVLSRKRRALSKSARRSGRRGMTLSFLNAKPASGQGCHARYRTTSQRRSPYSDRGMASGRHNPYCRHGALVYRTPAEFAAKHRVIASASPIAKAHCEQYNTRIFTRTPSALLQGAPHLTISAAAAKHEDFDNEFIISADRFSCYPTFKPLCISAYFF